MEMKKKRAGVAVLVPHKRDIKAKAITRDKEGPRSSTSGCLSKKPETLSQKDTYIHMFTAVLFTLAKIWKQPKCPSRYR